MAISPKNHFTNHPYAAHDDNVAVKDPETKGETLMKRILSVLCLSLLSASAVWAIRNGTIDTNGLYRGVGEILPTATHAMCTATLVSRNAILTTADCFYDPSGNTAFTFSPSANRAASVLSINSHPYWGNGPGSGLEAFDVAVGILDKSKNRGWSYRPYPLNTSPLAVGTLGTAVGYGMTQDSGTVGIRNYGTLLFAGYGPDGDGFGGSIVNAYEVVTPGTNASQMICPGDTGGPYLVNGQIAGLAAFAAGSPCSQAGPGFEMTIDRLAPWITATLNQYDPPGACNYNDDTTFATLNGGCEDQATKLVWGKIDARATQAGATAECAAETEAGVTGWRLPTGTEYSILASDDPAHHVIRPTDDGSAWTSDVRGSLGGAYSFGEYNVYFGNPTYLHRVLCVRAGS